MFEKMKEKIELYKIIKNDNNFDFASILNLLRFKMVQMEKFFSSGDSHVMDAKRVAKQLRYGIFLIDRYYDDRWDDPEYVQLSEQGLWKASDPMNRFTDRTSFTPEERAVEEKLLAFYIKTEEIQQDALKRLFKHMSKHMQSWWD
jgi:hypothetical protein